MMEVLGDEPQPIVELGEYLQRHLRPCTDQPVYLHILTDSYALPTADEERYDTMVWKNEFLARKRLVLIFQRRSAGKPCLVIGLSAHEYASREPNGAGRRLTRSYIQYVDTTGLFEPRPNQSALTKGLVSLYIAYARDVLRLKSVHLLASAKPSFLFAGSEFNPAKARLSTARLVKWWLGLVGTACAGLSGKSTICVWSPGEDLVEDDRTRERIARRQAKSETVEWQYGPPFLAEDRLADVVPLFEDDPKFKHFCSVVSDYESDPGKIAALRAKAFIETFGLRPEFRNQAHSTIIILNFGHHDPTSQGHLYTPAKQQTNLTAFATKMLQNLTFEDEAKAFEASGRITSWLKFMGSRPVSLELDSRGAEPSRPKRTVESPAGEQPTSENAPINVQGLVRKRPKLE